MFLGRQEPWCSPATPPQTAFSTRGCQALLQQAVPRRSSCCCAWQRALRKPSKEYVAAGMDKLCSGILTPDLSAPEPK